MNEAVARMLARYQIRGADDSLRALREIMQEVALFGLWRARFFEHGAFYGGTALRILHGMERFSEDLDFSLLAPSPQFELGRHLGALEQELAAFGFDVRVEAVAKAAASAVQSAFLKANTRRELLVIGTADAVAGRFPTNQLVKVKLEVDTDPPLGFVTEMRHLLHPVPFAVRAYALPDLFAGKMHAILFRRWVNRVKGRDWYDFVWFAANHPHLHLHHLEQRMRQTGHWTETGPLSPGAFRAMIGDAIDRLDISKARREVEPFVPHRDALAVWSHDFFRDVAARIILV